MTHRDAVGEPIDHAAAMTELDDAALETLMGICHTEPADPTVCVYCAAFMEAIRREEQG